MTTTKTTTNPCVVIMTIERAISSLSDLKKPPTNPVTITTILIGTKLTTGEIEAGHTAEIIITRKTKATGKKDTTIREGTIMLTQGDTTMRTCLTSPIETESPNTRGTTETDELEIEVTTTDTGKVIDTTDRGDQKPSTRNIEATNTAGRTTEGLTTQKTSADLMAQATMILVEAARSFGTTMLVTTSIELEKRSLRGTEWSSTWEMAHLEERSFVRREEKNRILL